MKRVLTSCLIVLICLTAFISGYSKGCYSYAEDINFMSDRELEAAYQAYLQSKGGSFIGNAGARFAYSTGKMLNFLISDANTTPYKNLNEIKGLMSWQRSELESGNSSVLQLAMSQGGASVFSLYTQWLLQNHYFGNGVTENDGMFDDGVNNNLYSGKLFIDDSGNSCLCTVLTRDTSTHYDLVSSPTYIKVVGSSFIKNGGLDAYNWAVNNPNNRHYIDFVYNSKSYWFDSHLASDGDNVAVNFAQYPYGAYYANNSKSVYLNYKIISGFPTIFWVENTNIYGYGVLNQCISNNGSGSLYYGFDYSKLSNISNVDNSTINFITNNNNNIAVFPTINEGDTLYITPKVDVGVDGEVNYQSYTINEGDNITNIVNNYYNDSGNTDKTITIPSTDPSGGIGGGDNPSGGTPPDWSNNFPHLSPDGEGGFNFNFTLPDLNIDWNISGLKDKFPFSIPFDLIHFVEVLNAEPETPEFDWTIDLKIYQWHIDADLHEFDNLAGIVRNVEFIGFCITLVMITRRMIKG